MVWLPSIQFKIFVFHHFLSDLIFWFIFEEGLFYLQTVMAEFDGRKTTLGTEHVVFFPCRFSEMMMITE